MGSQQDERLWGLILHLSVFAGYAIPIAGLAAPVVIWQIQKQYMPILDQHGKNVINWILSMIIYAACAWPLCFVLIGFPLLFLLGLVAVVFPIIGALKAYHGEVWVYPLSLRFFK